MNSNITTLRAILTLCACRLVKGAHAKEHVLKIRVLDLSDAEELPDLILSQKVDKQKFND